MDGTVRLCVLVALFIRLFPAPAAHAQTLSYSVAGRLITVPPCVSTLFSVGDPWTMEVIIDLSPPEEEAPADGEPESDTDGDPESEADVADEADGDAVADESVPDSVSTDSVAPDSDDPTTEDEDNESAETDAEPEFTATVRHPAHAFAWAIGSVVGTATGVTRVFVSNDHLEQDGIAWQALGYSATFEPRALGGTAIRGIQAGLVDRSGSVFETTDLPKDLALPQFDDGGFFQVFFRTKCGVFRNNPITGSVSWVDVNWNPAPPPADLSSPGLTGGQR